MRKVPKCQMCHEQEATWARQEIDGEIVYSLLGWQYRGFRVIKVCVDCKDGEQASAHPTEYGGVSCPNP